ncbi:hypothetical protein COV16_04780 [Candidatus Woesearchaeota archaeon CG10_big_fil_rev_8_21_14_0_10_34_8]|nr:MAG: hypothetical protein COV16_04780 [Candidatus Woesearchaeota archaeon CG10_big_fil_rev_8_21_14_0_10_34_8]
MLGTYTPAQLRAFLADQGKRTTSNYQLIELVQDTNIPNLFFLREVYGPHGLISSETWRHYHFPRASPDIVLSSYHEGNNTMLLVAEGRTELKLVKAQRPIGIESLVVHRDEAEIIYAGYAGGGVSASIGRGLAEGVNRIQVIQEGGGEKLGKGALWVPVRKHLIFAVDDTDNHETGATYDLVGREVREALEDSLDIRATYIAECNLHGVVEKTSNCFATAVGVTYDGREQTKEAIKRKVLEVLREKAMSDYGCVVFFDGFIIPQRVEEYGVKAKNERIESLDYVIDLAGQHQLAWHHVGKGTQKGKERGLKGALAALGLFWKLKYCAAPPGEPVPDDAKFYPDYYTSNQVIQGYAKKI